MRPAAVVIPYFQRDTGLLARAVRSVLAQRDVDLREVIVVDDESPVPAESELVTLMRDHPGRIRIIKQNNAGCGVARNTGIENVSPGVEVVAFIDSDDVWLDGHLANAAAALGEDYDFYFCDFYFPDYKEKTAFNRAGKIKVAEHRKLPVGIDCYEYNGDMFHQILVTGNVIGASAFAYRYDRFPEIRYRGEYFNCQDYLFYLDFSLRSSRICFSTRPGCDYGVGVNIFAGAKWGTPHMLRRLRNEIKAWRFVHRNYRLTEEQAAANLARINDRRRSFTRNLIYMLMHTPGAIDWKVVSDLVRLDSSAPLWVMRFATASLATKMLGRK